MGAFFSKHFTNDLIPDQTGKVAVVTGGNTGVGYQVALQLAHHGSRVYIGCRNEQRALDAIARIQAQLAEWRGDENYKADVHYLPLDQNSLKSVDEAATRLLELESRIDILVNNAGIMGTPYGLSADGIESQFAVNHVGTVHFTERLLGALRAAGTPERPARLVFTSSMVHTHVSKSGVELTLEAINDPSTYSSFKAYGRSKLANILTAKYYAEVFEKESEAAGGQPLSVLTNAVHPGAVNTEIVRNAKYGLGRGIAFIMSTFNSLFALSPENGALTTLYVATSEEVQAKQYNGQYFVPYGNLKQPSALARSKELRDNVWTFTKSLISSKLSQ